MTLARRKIHNYIFQIRELFTIVQVSEDTGIAYNTVRDFVVELVNEGKVEQLQGQAKPHKYRYIYTSVKDASRTNWDFTPDRDKLKTVWKYSSADMTVKEIAKICKMGYTTCLRYLRFLERNDLIRKEDQDCKGLEFPTRLRTYNESLRLKT